MSFKEMCSEECGVILFREASEYNTLKGLVRLQHTRLCRKTLNMRNTFESGKAMHEQFIDDNRLGFCAIKASIIDNLNMAAKPDDLLSDLALEP